MKKVLFLNDGNGFEYRNPLADLVEIPSDITKEMLKELEHRQPGAYRTGGNLRELLKNIPHKILSSGRQSDYSEEDYTESYKLISGNY